MSVNKGYLEEKQYFGGLMPLIVSALTIKGGDEKGKYYIFSTSFFCTVQREYESCQQNDGPSEYPGEMNRFIDDKIKEIENKECLGLIPVTGDIMSTLKNSKLEITKEAVDPLSQQTFYIFS